MAESLMCMLYVFTGYCKSKCKLLLNDFLRLYLSFELII